MAVYYVYINKPENNFFMPSPTNFDNFMENYWGGLPLLSSDLKKFISTPSFLLHYENTGFWNWIVKTASSKALLKKS